MAQPFFSVVIPVHNAALTLRQCVESVLRQTFEDLEVFLVEDGSVDDSRFLADELARTDSRVTVIKQANSGVSSARNQGLSRAKGRYVVFIDADDYIMPDRLARLRGLLSGTGKDVIATGFTSFDSLSGSSVASNRFSPLTVRDDAFRGDWAVVWRYCFGAQCLETIRFNETISYGEDYLFVCQALASSADVSYVSIGDEGEYMYRVNNAASLMAKQRIPQVSDQCKATEMLEEHLRSKGLLDLRSARLLNVRKNWCRLQLMSQTLSLFGMKDHASLWILKKAYAFMLRKVFIESKELH